MRLDLALTVIGASLMIGCGKKADPTPTPAPAPAPAPAADVAPASEPDVAPAPAPDSAPAPEPDSAPAPADSAPEPEPDAAPALAPETISVTNSKATGPALDGRWCVVLGSGRLSDYDKLVKPLAEAKEKGFPDAGIYDAREFDTFTWGDLVLIGTATADKESAEARAKEAKAAKLSAFAKECRNAGPKGILTKDEVPPAFELPTTPATLDLENLFAWSDQDQRLAQVTSSDSIQGGGNYTLDFAPTRPAGFEPLVLTKWGTQEFDHDDTRKLSDSDAKRVTAELARGGYVALDKYAPWWRLMERPGTLRWRDPDVTLTWTRKTERVVEPMAGSWNDHTETFTVSCGDQKVDWLVQPTHDDEPVVSIGLVPTGASGKHSLLLKWSDHWGIEGDSGGDSFARAFDLSICTPK